MMYDRLVRCCRRADQNTTPRRVRPTVPEPLESRVVPAAVFWDGGGDNVNWGSANNWSNNQVPGPGDDVTIDVAGTLAVNILAGAFTVNSLTMPGNDILYMDGGTLTITSASTVGDLRLISGTLNANGGMTVTTALTWHGGSWFGTLRNEGAMTVAGDPDLRGVLDNAGTVSHLGQIDFFAGGQINNLPGGIYDIAGGTNGTYLNSAATLPGFFNSGIFRKSGAATSASLSAMPFHNQPGGVIEVTTGTLNIGGSGMWQGGSFIVEAGAALVFNGSGVRTWTNTFTGSGAGSVEVTAGEIAFGTGGATLNFPAGYFSILGNVALTGTSLTNAGVLTIGGDVDLHTTIHNAGTVSHVSQVDFFPGSRINNLAGGIYDITGATNGSYFSGGATSQGFFNSGTFRKSGSGTSADVESVPFHNQPGGVLEIQTGVMNVGGGGNWQGGTFTVGSGAVLRFNGGAVKTWTSSFTGSGAGSVEVTGAAIAFGAGGAILNFPANFFSIAGNTDLTGTYFTNIGALTIGGDTDLRTVLNNAGLVSHPSQIDCFPNSQINNLAGGTWDVIGASGGSYLSGGQTSRGFFNSGTFRKSGAAGSADVASVPFHNQPGGALEIQAGTMDIGSGGAWQGGDFTVAAGASLRFVGSAIKTWTGAFTGSGAGSVVLSSAAIAFGTDGATLNFPAGFFSIGGNTNLTGTSFTNAGAIAIGGDPDLRTIFHNAGAVTHTGQFDFFAGARINNLEGATYDISGTTAGAYFSAAQASAGFFNSGFFRRTAGGSASLGTVPFNNAGTVDVLTGALTIGSLAQLSAGTLNGGTWKVYSGGTLSLPAGFTTNAATIILDGAGAGLTQLANLATNAGTLKLVNGADLTRSGALTNTGTIALSPESVLTVTTFTQSEGNLDVEIAGNPASGLFGRLAVTGVATLGGTLTVKALGNFAPAAGDSYAPVTYGSRTGALTLRGTDPSFVPAFELVMDPTQVRLNSLIAAPDIEVTSVAAPGTGFVGRDITIDYTVTNLSDRAATVQQWTDAIYLSRDGVLDPSDVLVAKVLHTGGLAALGTYSESITAPIPGILEGEYQVLVIADNRFVAPDLSRGNNTAVDAGPLTLGFEALALGAFTSGTIANGQDIYFRLDLAAGTDVFLTGTFDAATQAEFLVKFGSVPTRSSFDFRAGSIQELEQHIRLLNPRGGAYYVMLHGREGAGAGEDFTLLADDTLFALDEIGQEFGANVGSVTIPLTGFGFTDELEVRLEGGVSVPAASVRVVDRFQAFATFNLAGIAPGAFDVVIEQNGEESTKPDAFTVQAGAAGQLEARVIVPQAVRQTRPYTITVEFENRGGTDIPVPLLIVQASAGNFLWAMGQEQTEQTSTLQFLGVDPGGLSDGVLRPGEKHTVVLNAVTNGTSANFKLLSTAGDSPELVNYTALKSSMGIEEQPDRYEQAFDQLVAELPDTYGELIARLAQAADDARAFGMTTPTFSEVFDFLIDREILELPGASVTGTLFVEDNSHAAQWPSITLRDVNSDAFYRAESFVDGRFALFGVPAGTYTVEATGFASLSLPTITLEGTPLAGLNVIGEPGESLEGRVLNAAGRGVANALVQLTDALGREFTTITDSNGRYRLEGLATGAAAVDIDATNLVPVDDLALLLNGAGTANLRDFKLTSGGTIAGRVVSPTGTPVAGATLVARLIGGNIDQSITAGFDGKFSVSGLPSGVYELVATGSGFGAGTIGQVQVTSGTSTPVGNVSLTTGGIVSGVVTDVVTGLPIAGAQFARSGVGQGLSVLSNANGAYTASNLTPGTFSVLISAPGYIARAVDVDLDALENFVFNAELRPLGRIDGSVASAGATSEGLELTLTPLTGSLDTGAITVLTDSSGEFSFTGLPDGQYALTLNSGGASVSRQVFTLNAADNTHVTTVNLGGSELTGLVKDAAGVPLAYQAVTLFSGGEVIDTALTDAEGRYRFLVLQPGAVDLLSSGLAMGVSGLANIAVPAGETVIAPDITLGGSTLTLKVEAAADGADLKESRIIVRSKLDALDDVSFGGFTDASGILVLTDILPGQYEVTVLKAGFAVQTQNITIGAGGTAEDFQLEAGRVITGTVLDGEGRPVNSAEVSVVDRVTGRSYRSLTNAAGEYQETRLPEGSYDVIVTNGALQAVVVTDVSPGTSPMRIDATLAASTISLTGVVRDASGDLLAGAVVRIVGPGGVTLRSTVADAAGAYTFSNLSPGDANLVVGPAGYVSVVTPIMLPADGTLTQDLNLGEAVALADRNRTSSTAGIAAAPALFFVQVPEQPAGLQANGVLPFDGLANDIVDSVPPPSPLGQDGDDYRFVFPEFDVDCPEALAAYKEAIESGRLLNLAYQGLEIEYDNLNDGNLAEIADLVKEARSLGIDMVNLADGIKGFGEFAQHVGKNGLPGVPEKFVSDILEMDNFFAKAKGNFNALKGGFNREAFTEMASNLAQAGDKLKGAIGIFADLDITQPHKIALGGDFAKLSAGGIPVIGDVIKTLEAIQSLEAKAAKFATISQENRGAAYLEQQDYYLSKLQEHQRNRNALDQAIAEDCGNPGPNPEDPDETEPEDEEDVPSVGSRDPNDIIGPAGFGPQNFVANDQPLDYTIRFENVATATAAAQLVTITQQLDSDLDASTFQLGAFGFGDFRVEVPAGRDFFQTQIDAREQHGVLVEVVASIDTFTGVISWTFSAIDPVTLDFTADPVAGFLPPNLVGPEGEGFVSYSIRADAGAASGTVIDAQARIVFDQNEPIDTPAIFHTLDSAAPTSSIGSLPGTTFAPRITFTVGGADGAGSGVESYDIYISDNGGAFELLYDDVAAGSYSFRGESGHTYSFASVAKDNVGFTEDLPLTGDASTTVQFTPLVLSKSSPVKFTDANGDSVTVTLAGGGQGSVVLDDPDGDGKGDIDSIVLTGTTDKSSLNVIVKKAGTGDGALSIGEVDIAGSLNAFNAKTSDLTLDGLTATGGVKTITVRDVLQSDALLADPVISLGGSAATKTTIKARTLGDGLTLQTPGVISTLSAASIGDGLITAAALGKLTTTLGAMNADLAIAGGAGPITVKLGANAGTWSAGSFGAITLGASLDADIASNGNTGLVQLKAGSLNGDIEAFGKITGATVKAGALTGQLTAATIGTVSITGGDMSGFIGANAAPAKTKGLNALTVTGGSITGNVLVAGSAGAITAKESKAGAGGAISAGLTAHSFGAITATGGDVSGDIRSTASATALGKTLALAKLTVTGGDLLGNVLLGGGSGAIAVKADKAGTGGNVTDIHLIAAKIASLTVAKNLTDAVVMAGASLGADQLPGGGDDVFGAGTIGAIHIGGNAIASLIAAGLVNPDGIPNNGDDALFGAGQPEQLKNTIASLIVKGSDVTGSYFAAGKFVAKPKIGAATIILPNPQFRTAS